jgi:hypothetical protein
MSSFGVFQHESESGTPHSWLLRLQHVAKLHEAFHIAAAHCSHLEEKHAKVVHVDTAAAASPSQCLLQEEEDA